MQLESGKVVLKPIEWDSITSSNQSYYVDQLNNMDTMKYAGMAKLDCHTINTVRDWINNVNKDKTKRLLGIFDIDGTLVGNIRLDIDWYWRVAIISLWIGYHNQSKGYGSEAIGMITNYAFNDLDMKKVESGILEGNVASVKAFEKNGFIHEGTRKARRYHKGNRINEILMGKVS